jgi:hypothetical protein
MPNISRCLERRAGEQREAGQRQAQGERVLPKKAGTARVADAGMDEQLRLDFEALSGRTAC